MVERQLCKLDVVGSIPISSTRVKRGLGPRRAGQEERRESEGSLTIEYEG